MRSPISTSCSRLSDSSHNRLDRSNVNLLEGEYRGAGSRSGGACVVQPVNEDVLENVYSWAVKDSKERERLERERERVRVETNSCR